MCCSRWKHIQRDIAFRPMPQNSVGTPNVANEVPRSYPLGDMDHGPRLRFLICTGLGYTAVEAGVRWPDGIFLWSGIHSWMDDTFTYDPQMDDTFTYDPHPRQFEI